MPRKSHKKMRRELAHLIDEIGQLKEDIFLLNAQLDANVDEAKELFSKLPENESETEYYKAVYEDFNRDKTDWKSLAMSFKPLKRRIKKFTAKQQIIRLKTFDI